MPVRLPESLIDKQRSNNFDGIRIVSFGYSRRAAAPTVDFTFDVRFIEAPPWTTDALSQEYLDIVSSRYGTFIDCLAKGLESLAIPIRIGIGCTSGQHRAVAISTLLAAKITNRDVIVEHLDKR